MLKVKLKRDLRKHILRGHPWVYRSAVVEPATHTPTQLCKVLDSKNNFVAWAFYQHTSDIALRILSTKIAPLNSTFIEWRLNQALNLRKNLFNSHTNAFRLLNGEGDLMPGLICDVYKDVAIVQADGDEPYEFWKKYNIPQWLIHNEVCQTVLFKPRRGSQLQGQSWGKALTHPFIEILENNTKILVDVDGQKTGFFLDQRTNRNYLQNFTDNKSVLNAFSYTGGFSIHAGLGQATQVISLDISSKALELAEKNWQLNDLDPSVHENLCTDAFEYLQKSKDKFDCIVVDPPSMAHSKSQKKAAINKYIQTFAAAARKLKPQGHIFYSSCTGQVSYEDFLKIIAEALSIARRKGQIIWLSGQDVDHPYPHACPELRYLKFVHLILD